jgi:hypothetical protein
MFFYSFASESDRLATEVQAGHRPGRQRDRHVCATQLHRGCKSPLPGDNQSRLYHLLSPENQTQTKDYQRSQILEPSH